MKRFVCTVLLVLSCLAFTRQASAYHGFRRGVGRVHIGYRHFGHHGYRWGHNYVHRRHFYRPAYSYWGHAYYFAPRVYYPVRYYSYNYCAPTYYYGGYSYYPFASTKTSPSYVLADVKRTTTDPTAAWTALARRSLEAAASAKPAARSPIVTATYRKTDDPPLVMKGRSKATESDYVDLGDQLFRTRHYSSALRQYETASRVAPSLAVAHFRRGHALVATGRYGEAASSFKRGLELNPDYVHSSFRLNELYGDRSSDATIHVENLAAAALKRTNDEDVMFLIGVLLHFEGQQERATKFFKRAADIAGGDTSPHLYAFLGPKKAPKIAFAPHSAF